MLFTPRLAIPAVEVLLLVALVATNPRRMTRQTSLSRWVSMALAGLVIITNLVVARPADLDLSSTEESGQHLLLGAMQIWVTNVIGFALLFWELDRDGPVARREKPRDELAPADWRFSQDENDDTVSRSRVARARRRGGCRSSSTTSTCR